MIRPITAALILSACAPFFEQTPGGICLSKCQSLKVCHDSGNQSVRFESTIDSVDDCAEECGEYFDRESWALSHHRFLDSECKKEISCAWVSCVAKVGGEALECDDVEAVVWAPMNIDFCGLDGTKGGVIVPSD